MILMFFISPIHGVLISNLLYKDNTTVSNTITLTNSGQDSFHTVAPRFVDLTFPVLDVHSASATSWMVNDTDKALHKVAVDTLCSLQYSVYRIGSSNF